MNKPNSNRIRNLLATGETMSSELTTLDVFELMTEETQPQRMYKLAKMYVRLVENNLDSK